MLKRTVQIGVFALGTLVALGATAYATTGADPDSAIGIVGATLCSIVNAIFH